MVKTKGGSRPLTPRQKRLVAQLPAVVSGKKTKKQALLDAGYSEQTSDQQERSFGSVRINTAMQEALKAAGFTEEVIAKKIVAGLEAKRPVVIDKEIIEVEDHDAQHKYLKTGAELADAFPAKKQINADATLEELIKTQEG